MRMLRAAARDMTRGPRPRRSAAGRNQCRPGDGADRFSMSAAPPLAVLAPASPPRFSVFTVIGPQPEQQMPRRLVGDLATGRQATRNHDITRHSGPEDPMPPAHA